MVHPSKEGTVATGGGGENGGDALGPLLCDIGKQPQLQRGSVYSSSSTGSTTSDVDAHSLLSGQDSVEPMPSEPDAISGNGVVGGSATAATSGKHKRPFIEDELRVVEQENRSNGQQLRKACDLCTKRKRKCNGQHPCSQCIETGVRNQCIYSPRLKSGRKKKVRIDGVLYEEGAYGGELVLAGGGGARRHAVDPSAGRFSPSAAVGLAGHVENFFLATYLRDFNRIVPLTTESSVTEGMLEVLSPAVSSRGLATANPIKQSESRRQAKLAVFWGVVAMGSRILGATDESTTRYLGLMRRALRECFDSNDKEVVQAYLLLSTVETMRGNEAAGKRYLDHAHTMHNGNAMGPEGTLLKDRSEQDQSLDLVFQIYDQPDGCVSGFYRSAAVGNWRRNQKANGSSSSLQEYPGMEAGEPSSAVDQMIAQAMSPPSESQSSPLKALKYLSTACGISSEVFDPTNKCVTVKQYLQEMDSALKGAHSLFVATDLGECITGVMMVKIWGGVTVLMRSWGDLEDRDIGLAQVEEGVGYALTRPGLFTFPMWWHALHCAAVTLAHFGRSDTYMRLRATFNKNTFPGTEMPPIEVYTPASICPQLGGSCSKLAYWLQVRGTMCAKREWKPHFLNGRMGEASENAAYAAAVDRGSLCVEKESAKEMPNQPAPHPVNGAGLVDSSPLRAALDAGLSEVGAHFDDLGALDMFGGSASELDLDLGIGAEFDFSQLTQEPEVAEANGDADVSRAIGAAAAPATVGSDEPLPEAVGGVYSMQVPTNLVTGRGGGAAGVGGAGASGSNGFGGMFADAGAFSRDLSFGISGPAAVSTMLRQAGLGAGAGAGPGALQPGASSGEVVSGQSTLDINTIMQMATSDEELKKSEGGNPDAIDNALEYGEGPAKELFGIDLGNSE